MKNRPIKVCNETIYPGEQLSLALPMPELHSCAPYYMPIKIVHGKSDGPCVVITAAIHGDELNGTEIINRLLSMPAISKLRGTLIVIPVVNVYGLMTRSRYTRGNVDLNEYFPGRKNGTHAERVAHIFTSEIFNMADYAIDLQTGRLNCNNLPQVNINIDSEKTHSLAEAFGSPVILNTPLEDGSIRKYAADKQIPMLTYEAGEAMHFDEHAIKFGVRGIMRVLRDLKMLSEKHPKKEKQQKSFFAKKSTWVRSSTSGMGVTKLKLGQFINKGDVVGTIKDPFGCNDNVNITSPVDGVVVSVNNLSLVHEGEGLVQIAFFPEMESAADHLETWEEQSSESLNKAVSE